MYDWRDLAIVEALFNGDNQPSNGTVIFDSNDHIRYHNGIDVSGHNYNCRRRIEVQKNIEGGNGYTVTIYNLDGAHPYWGTNVQMAPKQMKIIAVKNNVVSLQGFGYDMMGNSFADYAIDLYFIGSEVSKAVLKMLDRNIELVYFK